MNPVSARLLNQQLICPQFTSPHDVVEWMGALQAQEFRLMRWAVEMRTKRPSAKAFKKDYDEGRIVKTGAGCWSCAKPTPSVAWQAG